MKKKIKLKNNLSKDIKFGTVDTIGQDYPGFDFKPLAKGKIKDFLETDKFVAFMVPKGMGFKITPHARLYFEFIQSKPNVPDPDNPDHDNMDTYVFRVINLGYFEEEEDGDEDGNDLLPSGDADVDPPEDDFPVDNE